MYLSNVKHEDLKVKDRGPRRDPARRFRARLKVTVAPKDLEVEVEPLVFDAFGYTADEARANWYALHHMKPVVPDSVALGKESSARIDWEHVRRQERESQERLELAYPPAGSSRHRRRGFVAQDIRVVSSVLGADESDDEVPS